MRNRGIYNLPRNKRKGSKYKFVNMKLGGYQKRGDGNGHAIVIDDFRNKSYTKFTVEGD